MDSSHFRQYTSPVNLCLSLTVIAAGGWAYAGPDPGACITAVSPGTNAVVVAVAPTPLPAEHPFAGAAETGAGRQSSDAHRQELSGGMDGDSSRSAPPQPSEQTTSPADLVSAQQLLQSLNPAGWTVIGVDRIRYMEGTYFWNGAPLAGAMLSRAPRVITDWVYDRAVVLAEFGCSDVMAKRFQRGLRAIDVLIYRFNTQAGAFGAYTVLREGASTMVVRGDRSSENDRSISFARGNYFVRLATTAEDDDEAKEMMSALADALAPKIAPPGRLPPVMSRLPQVDRLRGSERLFMGPLTARRFCNVPYLSELALDQTRPSAYADYVFTPPRSDRVKLMIVDYGDPSAAREVFDRYIEVVDSVHPRLNGSPSSALFKFGDAYMYCQMIGSEIAIISGARRRASPLMLARQLAWL